MCFFADACERWLAVQAAVWETLPELCSFSAMRALHFVTPAIVVSDATQTMATLQEVDSLWTKAATWSWLVLSRIAILLFGLDALMLKCRENQPWSEGRISLYKFWMMGIFVKQILGIVQLGMFVRERLFIFVFAGEDSQMQAKEVARKEVWNALLAMKIYQTFGLWKSVAIMLSFDDTDFQKLVFNEKARSGAEEKVASVFSDRFSSSASSSCSADGFCVRDRREADST
ncbi:GIP [Symbiodinium natans]|uniref:GIP protein n=1 Tax=Symbiodinium natans TaxID=878477 RepID=A0A812RA74_9DINO|nr:GIP [Symbiodinium natans]